MCSCCCVWMQETKDAVPVSLGFPVTSLILKLSGFTNFAEYLLALCFFLLHSFIN